MPKGKGERGVARFAVAQSKYGEYVQCASFTYTFGLRCASCWRPRSTSGIVYRLYHLRVNELRNYLVPKRDLNRSQSLPICVPVQVHFIMRDITQLIFSQRKVNHT